MLNILIFNPKVSNHIILADNYNIIKISSILKKYNCNFTKVESKKKNWSTNYIY